MKAVKMNVELQRQLEEAEKEIEQKKAEAAQQAKAEKEKAVKAQKEEKPAPAEIIVEQGKSFLALYGKYLATALAAMVIALIGSYFAIGAGVSLIGGMGGVDPSALEILIGVLFVILGMCAPVAFDGIAFVLTTDDKASKLLMVIPMGIGFILTVIFLFIV